MSERAPTNRERDLQRTREQLAEIAGAGFAVGPEDAERVVDIRMWGDEERPQYYVKLQNNRDPEEDVDDYFPQVERAQIRATRRRERAAKRLGEMILTWGDGQVDFRLIRNPRTQETRVVPLQNVEMHRIILQMNAYYMPEYTVNGGDFSDLAALSRFDKDSDHFDSSTTLALQWIHDFNAQLVADNPNAKFGGKARHIELPSNHADRARKQVLKHLPHLYNFYRPGEERPAWTYYSMAKLGELGIEGAGGYPGKDLLIGDPEYRQLLMKHGKLVGKNAIHKEAQQNPEVNVARFHGHGFYQIKKTTRDGEQLTYLMLPSSCLNDGPVPGYNSSVDDFNEPVEYHNPDHTNAFGIFINYGKGRFEYKIIEVVDGIAYFDNKVWDGRVPFDWEKRYGYLDE